MNGDIAQLPSWLNHPLAVGALLIGAGYLLSRFILQDRPLARLACQLISFAGLTAMLGLAGATPMAPSPPSADHLLHLAESTLKIVWWLAASWLLSGLFRAILVFKRQPRETRFLQDLLAGFAYVLALLGIIANVFGQPVSALLAASGVVAIVLGLALQSTLGDLFSGFALNLSKPYHPGDWVILEGGVEGRIIETTWRATHLLTADNDLAVIPNSVVAKARIVNASRPHPVRTITLPVRFEPTLPPSRARQLLETVLLASNRIRREPAPSAAIRALDGLALSCEIRAAISSVDQVDAVRGELIDLLFRHCASLDIALARPDGVPRFPPPAPPLPAPEDRRRLLLDRLPLFSPLSDEQRAVLAPRLRERSCQPGDVLLPRGALPDALFIVGQGVMALRVQRHGREDGLLRLSPGECFGQASLLTGAPSEHEVAALTQGKVFALSREDIAPILKERPAIAAELGRILAGRDIAIHESAEEEAGRDRLDHGLAQSLAERVRALFGLD